MLEIILIVLLTKKNGKICKAKNIKPGGYQAMTVLLWIVLEVLGIVIGTLLFPRDTMVAYLFALVGAGIGALISYMIVSNLQPQQTESSETLDSGLTSKDFR